jgi:hypothetical protein
VRVGLGADFPAGLDDTPGAGRVVLISDGLWQRRFNAAPDVVGIREFRQKHSVFGLHPFRDCR